MPRHAINDELSFRYPSACTVQPRFNGRGFRLDFEDADPAREAYYVKWIQTKSPRLAWEWLASSPFDKKQDLEPVAGDIKVAGFRLRRLPDLSALKLGHGEYASFRGSEYDKDYAGTEWIELTWARMYARTVDEKLKVTGMGFTASGEAAMVAGRVREHLMNLHSGFLFQPPGIDEWRRIEFPAKPKRAAEAPAQRPAARPSPAARNPVRPGPSQPSTRQCGACSGSGDQVCSACNGSGGRYDSYTSYDWEGNPQYEQQWVGCFCSGGYTSCGACGGRGYVYV